MATLAMPRRPSRRPAAPTASADGPLPYAAPYHTPVLAREVVDGLVTDRHGVYVDGTLGGGGHAAALLDALADDALVIGMEQDAEALASASARLASPTAAGRFRVVRANFADVEGALAGLGVERVDGVLLDLGVSSHQLDEAARGFAFAHDGPLDMRMDAESDAATAADLVNALDEKALADLIYAYGEETRSRAVAREVVRRRPLATTGALAAAVRAAVPFREEGKALARVFQALRIAVNGEMDALEAALSAALRRLKVGGRLAVISYHSLEDRRAKHFLRSGNLADVLHKDFYGQPVTPWALVTRQPVTASEAEVARNPRARSARLRIAEKKAEPDAPTVTDPDPPRRRGA